MEELPPIAPLSNPEDGNLRHLEKLKLEAEIAELQKRRKPAYLQAVASCVIAVATVGGVLTSAWFNNQIKQLQNKKDDAESKLEATNTKLQQAETDKKNAQEALSTLQGQIGSTKVQVTQIIRARESVRTPNGSSSQEKQDALLAADKALQQSLARLQTQLDSSSKQSGERSPAPVLGGLIPAPVPSARPDTPQENAYTVAARLERLQERLSGLDGEWSSDLNYVDQIIVDPFRHSFAPTTFPTELPPILAQRLDQQDQQMLTRYTEVSTSIREERTKALSFIKMTPEQLVVDKKSFEDADLSAKKKRVPPNVAGLHQGTGRFREMNDYLAKLIQRLRDTRTPKV